MRSLTKLDHLHAPLKQSHELFPQTIPSVIALDICNGAYCTSPLVYAPTKSITSLTTGQTTTCEQEFPADFVFEAQGVPTDCTTTQSVLVAAGCCEIFSDTGDGTGNACQRCADFTPTTVVSGDAQTCGEIFPLSAFDAFQEGSANCVILQSALNLSECCESAAGTPGETCARCPEGEDDFLGSKVAVGGTETCAEVFVTDDFLSANEGSVICDTLQSAVVLSGCCATNSDDNCLSELSDFAQCSYDNPDCEDACDNGAVDTEPADDNCETDFVNIIKSCCPVCASVAENYYTCACADDIDNDSAGHAVGTSLGVAMITLALAVVAI